MLFGRLPGPELREQGEEEEGGREGGWVEGREGGTVRGWCLGGSSGEGRRREEQSSRQGRGGEGGREEEEGERRRFLRREDGGEIGCCSGEGVKGVLRVGSSGGGRGLGGGEGRGEEVVRERERGDEEVIRERRGERGSPGVVRVVFGCALGSLVGCGGQWIVTGRR